MEANKVTVTIKVEVLSIDTVAGLLQDVITQIMREFENGRLVANDGDLIEWDTKRENVKF